MKSPDNAIQAAGFEPVVVKPNQEAVIWGDRLIELLVSLNVRSRSKMSLEEMLPAVEKHLRQQPSFRILRITGIILVSGFGSSSEVEDVRQVARSKVMTYKRVSF